jgi:hypothetical protein
MYASSRSCSQRTGYEDLSRRVDGSKSMTTRWVCISTQACEDHQIPNTIRQTPQPDDLNPCLLSIHPSVRFIATPHRHLPASVPVAWNSKCLGCGLCKFLLHDYEWDKAWCHFCQNLRDSCSHPSLYTSNILWWDRIRWRDSYSFATVVYKVYISHTEYHRSRQPESRRDYQSICLSWGFMEFKSYFWRLWWWLLCAERWWVVDAIALGTM